MWMKMIRIPGIPIIFTLITLETISALTNGIEVKAGNSTQVISEKDTVKPQNVSKPLVPNESNSKTQLTQGNYYSSIILSKKYTNKCEEYNKCKNNSIAVGAIDVKKGVIIPKCGLKEFFISDISNLATADSHSEACCALGLRTAQIDNKNDIKCIKTFIDQSQAQSKGTVDTLDQMFLIAAQDSNYSNEFMACPSLLPISKELWSPGEPNNLYGMELCVALSLKNDSTGFVDIYCNIAMRFLCQKKQIRKPKSDTDYSFLVKGQYNKKYITTCQTANNTPSVTVLYNSDGTIKFERLSEGTLLPPCNNKQYFLSSTKNVAQGMYGGQKCLDIGAVYAELNEYSQIACIKKHFKKYLNQSQKVEYWVQGFDIYLNRSFFSCPTMKVMPDDVWMLGEPDNAKGMETCVALQLDGNNFGLGDKFCLTASSYICEFTIKKSTTNSPATSSSPIRKANVTTKPNKPVPLPTTQPVTHPTTQKEEEDDNSE